MSTAVFAYPHHSSSFEPSRLTARGIWRVGSDARDQFCRHPDHPCIDIAEVVLRSRRLLVNGVRFDTHWECSDAVIDDEGRAALGSVQHDAGSDVATIALNPHLIGDRDDLWRSTAGHELGHAIFDVPGWITASGGLVGEASPKRVMLRRRQDEGWPKQKILDWTEWRATEFMGAFLAPRRLLAAHLLRKAVELGLPLTLQHSQGTPVLNIESSGHDGLEAVVLELAELFGLSPSFVHIRLRKYRLLHPL